MTTGTEAADTLTDLVLAVFRLNGRFLEAADRLAAPAGLTAARWQVLGAVLREPKSVAEIGRDMGLARQSVQRLADILAEDGLAAYADNPAHRRAKLLSVTEAGWTAIRHIARRQHAWANSVSEGLDPRELKGALALLRVLALRVEQAES
ncbi:MULTISPECIES: MarR family transcriptional regulator [Mesorhizobium]|uniref:DNA-binding MarR family transcriptional regulator n=1 Tax=Mesorhizobium shonense TaxID=1209948 RepID=A0ABV2HTV7_9HYPH|nr:MULTISPECIES: MarR family transcriptional regulator [unclassified Mesorhizobium]AZO29261.1 MarR family transcriptional regulator [Mesorhizobium sp. M1B.F.Ca.ET.045.04.1.1]RWB22536.1 MAG: MarR family transcriptional regulator [Mesorhizobium sp.]RWE02542.1 MAG: MarR family transcriptional regulator [Mesorhizobium sp.]TIS52179.1 MAG: MarR family transcriptional regulator [Mesorhizobium sp.]